MNEQKKTVLYYGRRNENAETHRQDTVFCFGDDVVILRDEWKANYDEIPLFGTGTHAKFDFDGNNHITSVKFCYMTEPRLGFWSNEEICEFDNETEQYELIQGQTLERKFNDPKPSLKSMQKGAQMLIDGYNKDKENDEEGLSE